MTRDISMHLPGLAESTVSASVVKSAQVWAPLVAALIVALLVAVAVGAVQRIAKSAKKAGAAASGRGGLFTGYDRRWSTSKTVAVVWTAVVAFMVVTEALLALTGNGALSGKTATFGDFMKHTLDDAANRGLYLILLGGPYAAALFAKTVVTSRVNNGTLQKTDGTPNQLSDVVSNDAGAVDLYDFQYTLFNFVAQVITVAAFCANEAAGLPALPNFIAFLTGGSALTYSVNKGVTTNQPVLTAVHPQSARIGDRVTAYGNNLTAVSAADKLKAAVAGVDATVVTSPPLAAAGASSTPAGGQDQVDFLVPAPPASVAWSARDQQQVSVTTPAGLVASMNNALTVVPDQPVAVGLSPALLAVASAEEYADIKVMMQGQFLATPGATTADKATAQISIRGPNTAAMTTAAYEDDNRVSFVLPADAPAPDPGKTIVFQVQLVRGASSTQPLALSVQVAPPPELDSITPAVIVADPGTSLKGQGITLAGANLVPPEPTAGSQPHVAQAGAEPLKAVVTDAATGTVVGQLADQPRAQDTAAVSLIDPLTAPAAGDTEVGITLQRGTLSSAPLTLTLRARHDAEMTADPIVAPAETPLAGHDVTLNSTAFSVNIPPAPSVRHIADATPLVAHIDAGGVPLDVAELPVVPDGQTALTFQLPGNTPVMPSAPGDGTTWAIQVSRGGHVVATGDLVLRNQ